MSGSSQSVGTSEEQMKWASESKEPATQAEGWGGSRKRFMKQQGMESNVWTCTEEEPMEKNVTIKPLYIISFHIKNYINSNNP